MRFLETRNPDDHQVWIVFVVLLVIFVVLLNSCKSIPTPPCHCPPIQPPEVIHVPVPARPIPLPTPVPPAFDIQTILEHPAPDKIERTKRLLVAIRHDLGELWRAYIEALETIQANNDSIE